MADIFDEINIELRQDRAKAVWNKYGVYVIGLAIGVVMIVAGSSAFTAYSISKNEKASIRYEALLTEVLDVPSEMRLQKLNRFVDTEGASYAILAQFLKAQNLQADKNAEAAVAVYDAIAADRSVPNALRDYAIVSAGYALVGTINTSGLEVRLRTLLNDDSGFRHAAREVIALSFYLEKDYLSAREMIETALQDKAIEQSHFERLSILSDIVKANMTGNKS